MFYSKMRLLVPQTRLLAPGQQLEIVELIVSFSTAWEPNAIQLNKVAVLDLNDKAFPQMKVGQMAGMRE